MGLILKIAAGVIIGSLFLQVITLKYIDYNYENQKEEIIFTQELHTKSIYLMNAIDFYYNENKVLPSSLSDLDCRRNGKCADELKGARFYIEHKNEWMVIEPFIISDELKYQCRSSYRNNKIPYPIRCTGSNRLSSPVRRGGE